MDSSTAQVVNGGGSSHTTASDVKLDGLNYSLHQAVFHGHQVPKSMTFSPEQINSKDIHGNTALHLAVILGRHEWVNWLIGQGANILAKNRQGWTPLAEAISYGDRCIIRTLLKKVRRQSRKDMENRLPQITTTLESIGSFYMELRWDFQSWIPLVSRILPSDVCKIYKKGSKLRVDSTLVDFNEMKWERGDISFIYNANMNLNNEINSPPPPVNCGGPPPPINCSSSAPPSSVGKKSHNSSAIMNGHLEKNSEDSKNSSRNSHKSHNSNHHGHHHHNNHHNHHQKRNSSSSQSKNPVSLFVLDNKKCVYQVARVKVSVNDIDDEVDLLMSSDIVSAQLNIDCLNFHRSSQGWLFKSEKSEKVGNFMADFYSISGIVLESRKRREHLTEEDLQRNKASLIAFDQSQNQSQESTSSLESNSNGGESSNECSIGECGNESTSNGNASAATSNNSAKSNVNLSIRQKNRRESLMPPESSNVTWSEYIGAPAGQYPSIGRPQVCKSSSKAFKANIAMSTEFPLSVETLLDLLEVLAPFKHLAKLREFCQVKLPPGFPVKIDLPILPTVSARVTFQEFAFQDNLPDSLFEVPDGFVEDPQRFKM